MSKKHLQRVADLGCIVCLNLGEPDSPAEIHHIRSGAGMGQKSSDDRVIPLCHPHHRTGGYGVAFHAGPKIWQKRYGYEEDLLDQTMDLLGTR